MLSILILDGAGLLCWVASIFDLGWRSAFSAAIEESMTAGFSPRGSPFSNQNAASTTVEERRFQRRVK